MSKKEQKLEFEHATIYQTNENCQVFTGPISGAIFAMPGSTVHQHVGNAEKKAEATEAEVVEEVNEEEAARGEETNYDSSCFKFPNELVKQKVAAVIKEFHHGKAVNLAVMEAALFDHNLLYKRDSHTAFIKALIHWHIVKNMTDEDITKIANGMSQKMKKMPEGGYKGWKGCDNERALCMKIEKALGADFPYDATRSAES